jgi:hypothetical protein
MEIVLHSFLLLTSMTSVSSLGLLRRTSFASSPIYHRSLSRNFFSLPEEMNVLFSENRQASLSHMGYYQSMSMSFLSMPLPTNAPSHVPVIDGTLSKAPSASSPETTVTDAPHSPITSTTSPASAFPRTDAPSDGTSSDSNDNGVKPIKTPVKTVTTKNTTSKINEAQEWRPEIVLPVVFLALIALLGLGAVVARRRRRGTASIGNSNSSISPSPSDTSVDATALHGVEV